MVLQAGNITKEFPGVKALNNVSFELQEGQIHALCGENGAGKSTLINVLSGVFPRGSYDGKIMMDGEEVHFETVRDASSHGIAVIHQELSLFNELTVKENMFINNELKGRLFLDEDKMHIECLEWLKRIRMEDVHPETQIKKLGVGNQQLIEIARVLRQSNVRVLILDEPTAALTETETKILLEILRELRDSGMAIAYISHKLTEVMQLADYVTVLRDGESVGGKAIADITEPELVAMMVGRQISEMFPPRHESHGDVLLEVKNYSVNEHFTNKPVVTDASFDLKEGEILGVFGLIGAGRTELMSSIFGSPRFKRDGKVMLDGQELIINTPKDSIDAGIFYCTEDRKSQGIIPKMNIRENITISRLKDFKRGLFVDQDQEIITSEKKVKELRVKTPDLETKIMNLSGGNQQKVLLARSLVGNTRILILDEPTRGIDIGAKQEIYSIINELAQQGISIIMVSSELPEILGLSNRVLVMHRGRITGEFDDCEKVTQEQVLAKAAGLN